MLIWQFACYVISFVSPGWICLSSNELCIVKLVDECSGIPEIQRSVRVHNNFTWEITVNGYILKSDSAIFLTLSQFIDSLSSLSKVVSFVNECDICPGNNDASFHILCSTKRNFTDLSGECTCDYV